MKDLIEQLFYVGGAVLIFLKLGSIALAVSLLVLGCLRFNRFLQKIHMLRSY